MLSSWAPLVRDLFRRGRTRRSAGRPAASAARNVSNFLRSLAVHPGEQLEERRLMAFDIVAAFAQNDTPFFVNGQSASTLTEAPQQITLRFSSGAKIDSTTLGAITVTRAGGDGVIGNANDTNVTPANGVGIVTVDDFPNQNQVVLRFAETLPDDLYRITIGGGLKTVAADSFRNGNAFNVDVRLDLGAQVVSVVPQPISRVGATTALQQSLDTVDVYFNANDPLQANSARNPRNYRLVETDPATGADIAVQIPQSVVYNDATGKATLTFAAPLGDKLYRLQVGGSDDENGTIATAVAVGTVFQQSPSTTPAYTTNSFLGDGSAGVNDVDFYKASLTGPGTLTFRVTPVAGGTPLQPVLRLFNAVGEEITTGVDTSTPNALIYTAAAAGTFHLGISSVGNAGYNAVTGVPATGTVGTTRGGYRLEILSTVAIPLSIDNDSSFGTATGLGTLGLAGQAFAATISPQPFRSPAGLLLFPSPPGTVEEPGHREIPLELENHHMPASTLSAATSPDVVEYSFPVFYGVDGQGNPLVNAITENQKQRAREILELYSRSTGLRFVEQLTGGLGIVTGDVRAVNPTIPEGALAGICGNGLAIMNSTRNWGTSEYGGDWQGVAMHEIGHALGLGHSYDIPSNMGSEAPQVLPGDYDLVHLSVLSPAFGNDIDVYSFQLEKKGRLSAETVIARPGQPIISTLDSVLTLYREEIVDGRPVRTMIARNDDSNGRDSFIGLELDATAPSSAKYTYYLAVTSTGNTAFNPEVEGSGANGRSDGDYRLQLAFTPAGEAANTIVDTTGTPLDGDRDGLAGGAFNFYFRSSTSGSSSNTVYVDKLAAAAGADGSLAKPFNTVSAALAAAAVPSSGKSIVRIVGNAPGAVASPYLIGTNLAATLPLADGATFVVPAGVTVMIDEGAVLKFRAQVIDVGSSSQLISRAGAALQVLGTPTNRVQFTSFHDDSLGGSSDGLGTAVTGGQWGGIIFRQDSDSATKQVFLNSVSQANIRYGGGQVTIDAKLQSISPLHLETSRPTIAFNDIRNSAGPAISADPNSFEESNGRAGPAIRGNIVRDNSVNALQVRIRTALGQPIDRLTVPARFASPDITYVIPENLFIAGGVGGYETQVLQRTGDLTKDDGTILIPGGVDGLVRGMPVVGAGVPPGALVNGITSGLTPSITLMDEDENPLLATQTGTAVALRFDTGIRYARNSGRLTIDPGVVVKMQRSRIELERGNAQLYAEGTPQKRVIFTSTFDNRFGAGGTFVVGASATAPAPGNWGGIIVNDGSTASIDNASISFGGGQAPVPGGFASFNTLSVDQGGLRLANSRFENNANGIYVIGAQPVIVGNDFRSNGGNLISIDANSLNSRDVPDPGRSTGSADRYAQYDGNRGPLVRGNRVTAGGVTGMLVRGGEITVESVWDDTDIVHVVQDEIVVSNFHTATGLRLMSSPTASLVVKLRGANAGLTATGERGDIDDRIGGTVQVIGQPGYPVIMTSLADDTVGASLDPAGRTVTDTNGDGSGSVAVAGEWRGLRFLPYSNDRNVAVLRETEPSVTGGVDVNASVFASQFLGVLAPNESGGDDNRRLGFDVHASIAYDAPTDVDVYSFTGYVGSEVWFDIDYTSASLDSMIELLNGAGTVLARSADVILDNNGFPSDLTPQTLGIGLPFVKNEDIGPDLLSTNPRDPGLRVRLPGATPGATAQYFVRVRSQPKVSPTAAKADYEARLRDADPVQPGDQVDQGATSGSYDLRIRLRQLDEKPGSTVRYADIRFPTVGVDVQGLPQRSPLTGDTGESSQPNDTLATAQYIGNVLQSDLNAISLAGSLSGAGDVDWYAFDVNYEGIQAIGGVNAGGKTFSAVFDIDYADGIRGDLTLSVFNSSGQLLFVGRDSNVAADQPAVAFEDVSRGSLGKLDPFIGPVQLPAGLPGGTTRYYVAVSSNERLPSVLDWFKMSSPTNPLVRLEPVSSVQRIVEDHIGSTGYHSGMKYFGVDNGPSPSERDYTYVPQLSTKPLFDLPKLADQISTIALDNVASFVSWQPKLTDPVWGGIVADDLDMRSDGRLYTYTASPGGANEAGKLAWISIASGATTAVGSDNIRDFPPIIQPTPLVDPVASNTNTSSPARTTTFKVDAHGAQVGTVSLANVKGVLVYTTTLPPDGKSFTGKWTFTSDASGNITFAPDGTIPTGMPSPSLASVNDQGGLSVAWGGSLVDIPGISMTGVEYTFNPTIPADSVTTDKVDAMAWNRKAGPIYDKLYYSVRDADPFVTNPATGLPAETGVSRLYLANPGNGDANDPAGTNPNLGRVGTIIQTPGNDLGLTTGMAFVGSTLYGVDNKGNLFTIDTGDATATLRGSLPGVNFQGLANGPQNAAGGPPTADSPNGTPGYFADKLFAIDADGYVYCFDPAATPGPLTPLPVFRSGDPTRKYLGPRDGFGNRVLTGSVTGFAFSPIDFPLWRATNVRGTDAGHGVAVAFDNTRDAQWNNDAPSIITTPPESEGRTSIYYGFDTSVGTAADGTNLTYAGVASNESLGDLASGLPSPIASLPVPAAFSVSLTLDKGSAPLAMKAGSPIVRVPTTRDLRVDMDVSGKGVARGAWIKSIDSPTQITLSGPATEDSSTDPMMPATTLTFTSPLGIKTLPFSLANSNYTDKPTLYFNYRIEGTGSTDVQLSANDGNWVTIASNDHNRSTPDQADKTLPAFASVSSRIGTQPNQLVQELFEGTGWRQARIDLGEFAGATTVRLRYNFKPGTGEGFYFDDIIVGHAERGEMVTGASTTNTSFFSIGTPSSFTTPAQILSGAYQLEIRRGIEYGGLTNKNASAVQIQTLIGTNENLVRGREHFDAPVPGSTAITDGFLGVTQRQNLRGDENVPRGQGQFIIEGNVISQAGEYGIRIDAAARDADTGASTQGAVKSTPTLNDSRLVPGVVVVNNILAKTQGQAAILFSGDPNSGTGPLAPVPYGRIVNNTIYGSPQITANGSTTSGSPTVTLPTTAGLLAGMVVTGSGIPPAARILSIDSATQIRLSANATATGGIVPLSIGFQTIGVHVTDNAAPTLLNNVFASLATGIKIDASSSAGTVVGYSAFHDTPAGVQGTNAVTLASSPFVNAAKGNFYPVAKSVIIDSGLDSLEDRSAFTAVTGPLGLPISPIVAPGRDIFGQLRSDDPGQKNGFGQGGDVFKDLGAIDRVDFVQPAASLAVPLDGSVGDKNPAAGEVRFELADARGIARFELQLDDVGVGIDKTTVVSEAFEVRRNGTLLVAGTDYSFNYLESSNRVVFEAAAIYPMGSYVISVVRAPVNGVPTNVITDLAGNPLLPNQADGTTRFSIDLVDTPAPPSVLVGLSGDGQVQLSWNAATSDGTPLIRYELQRATNSTFAGATAITLFGTAVIHTDLGVVNGTQYWYRVRAVNSIGESGWSNEVGPIVPLPIPTFSLAQDTGSSTTDGITSNPLVNVVVQGGATWEYSVNDGTTWTTGTGASFSLPANATYAAGAIRVRQLAGESRSGERSNSAAITIDTIAPSAPITAVTDDVPTVTGPVANNGKTNDTMLVLSGTTEAGAVVEVFEGTTSLGNATVTGTTWTFTTGTLTNGTTYVFKARSTDLAGNIGPDSSTHTVTIDTTPPTVPTITAVTDNVAPVTGSVADGGVTNDTVLVLSGTTEAGTTVEIFNGAAKLGDAAVSGTNWTFTTSTLVNGTTYAFIARAANSLGNTASSVAHGVTIDTSGPTVSITSDKTSLKGGDSAAITFTLSEASTTFEADDVTVAGGTLSGFTGSGTSYSATFTPTPSSTASGTVTVAASQFTDTAGNGNTAGSLSPAISIDSVAPTVSITSNKTSLKGGDTATITFTLSEASTSFAADDVTVAGGTLSGFTGSGTSYSATFTPAANSTANGTVTVTASQFTDTAGNGNTAGSLSPAISIDTVAPTVSITSNKTGLKSGDTATITFTLSEASTSFAADDVTFSGGTLSGFTGSGTSYSATFTPTANFTGNGTVTVAAARFTDAAGNSNTAGSLSPAISIDTVAPTVSIKSNKTSLKSDDTATITFTLSETSTTFTDADVTVAGGTLSGFTGSGTTYSATFTPTANFTGNGTVTVAASQFTDTAGNGNTAGSLSPAISIDTIAPTAPTITSVTDNVAPVIGLVASGGVTNDTVLVLVGTTEAGTTVAVFKGTTKLGDATVTGTNWTYTTPALTDDIYEFKVVATDAAGNGSADSATHAVTIDTTAPTVTITTNPSSLKSGDIATITFTLSEVSTTFTAADVTAAGGTLSGFTGSGTTYSATFTPTANSTANGTVTVAAARFTDAAGNSNTAGSLSPAIAIDTVAPTVSITSNKTSLKSGDTATITFTLSEASTSFAADDVTFAGGTLSGFTGSGTSYSATFTPTANFTGSGTVTVAAARFTDTAGNGNTAGSLSPAISIDTVAPTVSITSNKTSLKSGDIATITFTLSEVSTTFTAADVTAAGGTLSGFTGSGTTYSATFTPTANSTANGTVTVAASQFTDTAGNGNTAGSLSPAISIDTVAPTVSITSNKTSLKSGDTATITFTLSEASTTFAANDVTVAGGTLSGFTGSDTTYSATFTPTANSTANGTVTVAAARFTDAAGNSNTAGSLSPAIAIDTVAPTVSITSNKTSLKSGDTATITFTLSEASTSFAADDVTAAGGTLSGFTGSGTSYSATFTPTASSTASGTVTVAASQLTDAAGNGNTAGSLSPAIAIDTVAPTVSITSNKTSLKSGDIATITFTLSEVSTTFTAADVTAAGGTLSGFTGSGTTYSATFTPTANSTANGTVTVAASQFTDTAGNGNTAGSLSPAISIDTVAPTVSITSNPSSLKSGDTATITFTLSEASTSFAANDVTVAGGTLSGFTGIGTTYSATFTPTANSTANGTVTVAAARFTDAAGNSNTAGSLSPAIAIDTVAPTVSITSNKTSLKSGDTATITFTLSEASTSFAADDVTFAGGTLSGFTGSGTSYSATFTPTASSTASGTVTVAASQFTDTAGNGNTAGSLSPAISIDTVAPTVSITSNKTSLKSGDTAAITFTLSEASTTFTAADVVVTGGTLSGFTGGGTTYSATFTPTANFTGNGTVTVAASQFTDAAGNGNTGGSLSPVISIDTAPPPVPVITAVIDDVPVFVGNIPLAGQTNDDQLGITGTAEPFALVTVRSGATVLGSATADANGNWGFTTSKLADGSYSLAAVATDPAGNTSGGIAAAAATTSFSVDTVAPGSPVITSVIDNVGAVQGNVAPGSRTDDTTLRITGTAEPGSRVRVRSGNLVLRTVNADAFGNWVVVTDPLPVRLHNLNATARDAAGNTGIASANHTVTIDQTSPTILSLGTTTVAGNYATGEQIAIFARTSERMRAGSAIDVTLNTGAVVRLSTTTERSELSGTYRIAPGTLAAPLSIVAVANISPIASDIAGNPVTSLPAVPVVLAGINVDATLRALAIGFSSDPALPTVTTASVTSIPISFSTDVTGVSLDDLQLFFGDREIVSLSTATITGSGRNYTLTLPANLTSRLGSFRLTIGPSPRIRAIDGGASLTVASDFYWRRV